MSIRIIAILILFSALQHDPVSAQEKITGLQVNSILRKGPKNAGPSARAAVSIVQLPFFDDFSSHSSLPDKSKWSDDNVFINNTFSDRQITSGIATFDILDYRGLMYETASRLSFPADQLTSQPINLSYPSSDNIYLSFLCQAGGLSDMPEKTDSLTLEFYSPSGDKWYSVWKAGGETDTLFHPVIIRIDNNRYLQQGFRFRFTNYATLSQNTSDLSLTGNCDIWNIDYVLIDRNRSASDTTFADVAYTLPVRSLLKSHEAMPWKQFRQIELQEMGSSIGVSYRNNDDIIRNVTRNFEIRDMYTNTVSHSFTAGATNIAPLTNVDYKANLIYTFNSPFSDSALFRITCSLKSDQFDPKMNDTLVYYQRFSNYFAFDDGSAEAGYGINGLGSRNAMFACRFRSFIPDTLRAVMICFNDSYLNSNKRAFDLMVWDDNNGQPGDVIYTVEEMMVEQGNSNNGFYTYVLPEGTAVDGIFYVGWKQRSETFLNAGFDINTAQKGRQFYWLNGEWNASQAEGSVMIRPVVGNKLKTVGLGDVQASSNGVSVWPNPAGNTVNMASGEPGIEGIATVTVSDLSGRILISTKFSGHLDISRLNEGIYFIVTTLNGRRIGINRLIKTSNTR